MEKVAELICSTVEDRSIMTGILVKNGYTVGPVSYTHLTLPTKA